MTDAVSVQTEGSEFNFAKGMFEMPSIVRAWKTQNTLKRGLGIRLPFIGPRSISIMPLRGGKSMLDTKSTQRVGRRERRRAISVSGGARGSVLPRRVRSPS